MASDEGVSLLKAVHDEVRETFQDQPLIEKSSRIMAFQDKMQLLNQSMDKLGDPQADGWRELSQEYRQYAKLIQDEMVGIKVTFDKNVSPAEMVAGKLLEQLEQHESEQAS
jgi:hypothetical protein